MESHLELDKGGFLEKIITSYETRILKIETAFQSSENLSESTHFLFENVQRALKDLRKERELLHTALSEILSKNSSLRRKDYNNMMSGILCALDKKEKEAKTEFLNFIEAQKETAQTIKKSLLDINDITSPDINDKICAIKLLLTQILDQQEIRKKAVMKSFSDLQQLHYKMTGYLVTLLEKGDLLNIKDVKNIRNQISIIIN